SGGRWRRRRPGTRKLWPTARARSLRYRCCNGKGARASFFDFPSAILQSCHPVMFVTAIIAAGGRGRRLGSRVPKQLLRVGGRPILERTVTTFVSHPSI